MGAAKKYGCAHNLCLTDGKVSATLYKVFKNHFGLGGPEKGLVMRKDKEKICSRSLWKNLRPSPFAET